MSDFKATLSPSERKGLFDANNKLVRRFDQLSPELAAKLMAFEENWMDKQSPASQAAFMNLAEMGDSSSKSRKNKNKGQAQNQQGAQQQSNNNNNKGNKGQKGTP